MKKLLLLIIFIISISDLSAQYRASTIKLGNFNPGATDMGFVIGYESGRAIDRNFDIGWSVDWFHKNYIDQTLVSEFNNYYGYFDSRINELRATTNLHSIPVLFNMSAKFPMTPRFSAYLTGGVGAEVLLIFYNNYQNPDQDDFKTAFDFNWRIGGGLNYQIGRYSDFIAEITYHSSAPSWTFELDDSRVGHKQILEREFDMSGIMTRIGFKFYY